MCLICMKYRIIILLLSLSAWVKYYYRILKTHHARMHACMHACTYMHTHTHIHTHTHTHTHTHMHARTHTHTAEPFRLAMGRWRLTVMARSAGDNGRRCFIQINTGRSGFPRFFVFFAYTELRRELVTGCAFRRYEQFDNVSRDDRARIATCSLLTSTDRNYSIDVSTPLNSLLSQNVFFSCIGTDVLS